MVRKRARDMLDAMETSGESTEARGKHRRAGALHLAFVSVNEAVKARAKWWDSRMTDKWSATGASPLEGVDAAISA